jgi:hypothetical protein
MDGCDPQRPGRLYARLHVGDARLNAYAWITKPAGCSPPRLSVSPASTPLISMR